MWPRDPPARLRLVGGWVLEGVVAVGCAVATTPAATTANIFLYFDWQPPPWVWLPAAATVGTSAWCRRRWPVWFLGVALAAWVTMGGFVAVVVAQYTLAERHRSWRVAAASTLITVTVVGMPIWWLGGLDASLPVSFAVCVAPALLGLYVGSRRELIVGIRERAERAERDRDARIRQARSEERNQIARDMHDVVTHRVSLMVLHATAIEAARGRDAITFAEQIGTIGREALDELRSLVNVLRTEGEAPLSPQPGLADLPGLVNQSCDLGLPVTLTMDADLRGDAATGLPALVQHAVYRVVQEALTNVRKHAGDAATDVQVWLDPRGLRLAVVNRAGTAAGPRQLPGGRHGLIGIAERVRLVGGTFSAEPTEDGGFRVEAAVPLAPDGSR